MLPATPNVNTTQRPGACGLRPDDADHPVSARSLANDHPSLETPAPTGKHPPRIGDRRHEATPLRMPVGVELRLRHPGKKVEPVPQGWQSASFRELCDGVVEGRQCRQRRRQTQVIVGNFPAADPLTVLRGRIDHRHRIDPFRVGQPQFSKYSTASEQTQAGTRCARQAVDSVRSLRESSGLPVYCAERVGTGPGAAAGSREDFRPGSRENGQ